MAQLYEQEFKTQEKAKYEHIKQAKDKALEKQRISEENQRRIEEEKIFQNEEIKLLLSAMNINPMKYDSKKLRYGKLGICSDAD